MNIIIAIGLAIAPTKAGNGTREWNEELHCLPYMTYHLGSISNVEETCKVKNQQKRFKQKLIALGGKKRLKKNIRQNGLGKMFTNFTFKSHDLFKLYKSK